MVLEMVFGFFFFQGQMSAYRGGRVLGMTFVILKGNSI